MYSSYLTWKEKEQVLNSMWKTSCNVNQFEEQYYKIIVTPL